jgi:hypothetical protein
MGGGFPTKTEYVPNYVVAGRLMWLDVDSLLGPFKFVFTSVDVPFHEKRTI